MAARRRGGADRAAEPPRQLRRGDDHIRDNSRGELEYFVAPACNRHVAATGRQQRTIGGDRHFYILSQEHTRTRTCAGREHAVAQARGTTGWRPGQRKGKTAALTQFALQRHTAAEQVGHALHQRQPKPRARVMAGEPAVQLDKGLKIRCWSSAAMPIPVSQTAIRSACCARSAVTSMPISPPSGVNFAALLSEIDQNLFQPAAVGRQLQGRGR